MRIIVPKDHTVDEKRVALVPKFVAQLVATGHEVLVEAGAGAGAFISDDAFKEAGATISTAMQISTDAGIFIRVTPPSAAEIAATPKGSTIIGPMEFVKHADVFKKCPKEVTIFDLELLPRITRAQEMDVLSSMSNLAGYYVVIKAAGMVPRIFPLLMTAAGTVTPSRVLIIGAGVAGLQAIATAKRLGAIVEAFDVRPAVKDQVESLGAIFIQSDIQNASAETAGGYAGKLDQSAQEAEHALLLDHVASADVVITTALIPQQPAPIIITEDMVKGMKPGSIIMDLAASAGGNCTLTQPGKCISVNGVTIDGPLNVASELAMNASQLLSHNLTKFLLHLLTISPECTFTEPTEDEILKPTCLILNGSPQNERLSSLLEGAKA